MPQLILFQGVHEGLTEFMIILMYKVDLSLHFLQI